jgi:predicted amidophosphoribosyltransferase
MSAVTNIHCLDLKSAMVKTLHEKNLALSERQLALEERKKKNREQELLNRAQEIQNAKTNFELQSKTNEMMLMVLSTL